MEVHDELFGGDGFDCYAWAEEALIECSGDPRELVPLVPQLTLLSQSLATSIHATLHQLSVSAPQLQTQLDALQSATAPLQQQLDAVVAHVGGSSSSSDLAAAGAISWSSSHRKQADERALEHLATLHSAKQRLQACSQALVEAAKWEKNVRASVAAVDDMALALTMATSSASMPPTTASLPLADRVHEMQQSLVVLRDLPGAADRTATLQALYAQIEAKLTPALVSLLRDEHVHVAAVQRCAAIFASIERSDVVRTEFCKSRPSHVHRLWFAFDSNSRTDDAGLFDTGMDTGTTDPPTATTWFLWLDAFYAHVLTLLERESRFARDVFGALHVESVLIALVDATFAPLQASAAARIVAQSQFRDSSTDKNDKRHVRLARLVEAFECSLTFAQRVAQLFRTLREQQSFAVVDGEDTGIRTGTTDAIDTRSTILSSVFHMYEPLFHDFQRIARDDLTSELVALAPVFRTGSFDTTTGSLDALLEEDLVDNTSSSSTANAIDAFAQQLEEHAPALWRCVDLSLQRCFAFSTGALFPDAIAATTRAVEHFVDVLCSNLPAMRQLTHPHETQTHHTVVDWSQFHATLALLRASGALERQLCRMEIKVRARVQEQLLHVLPLVGSHPTQNQTQNQLQNLSDRSTVAAAVAQQWLLAADAAQQTALIEFVHAFDRSSGIESVASTLARAVMLEDAQHALQRWTRGVQQLTFDSVVLPIAKLLERVASLPTWHAARDTTSAFGNLPTFSALPQECITAVADLLLSLLPQLEQFAESQSLEHAALATRGLFDACVAPTWRQLGTTLRLNERASDAAGAAAIVLSMTETAADDDENPNAPTDFVDCWTTAVASATLATLLQTIVAIPTFTDQGTAQLKADLSYFYNVLSAVSGEPNALVEDVCMALALDVDGHAAHCAAVMARTKEREASDDGEDDSSHASDALLGALHEALVAKRVRGRECARESSTAAAAVQRSF